MITDPRQLPGLLGIPLSDEQLAAATAPLDPQLIVAGAGTGKTTVMAARVVWLVATGSVAPAGVLGLTFTNKAASELRQRIDVALRRVPGASGHDGEPPTVLTYHAFAGSLLAEYGALLGVEHDSRLLADGQRSRLAYSVACDPVLLPDEPGSPATVAGRVLALDDALADLDVSTDELRAHDDGLATQLVAAEGPATVLDPMLAAARERSAMSRLVDQFREAKLDRELLDFADQVRLASRLCRELPMVGEQLRDRFDIVLLDEYQDTSRGQRRMLQASFAGHPVTAVGDPCQAIYGWRGASVTNIDQFPSQFGAAGRQAQVSSLTINRRSGASILTAANAVATDLQAFHRHVRPLRPPGGARESFVRCALLRTWDEELAWVGQQIADHARGADWSDVAVLCRSNDQVTAVAEHLTDSGIPIQVLSRQNLLALPEVTAVSSLLRLLVDPCANPELIHHLIGPRWRIGPRDLALLGRRAAELTDPGGDGAHTDAEISLLDAVHDPGPVDRYPYADEARQRFAAFRTELRHLQRLQDRSVVEVVEAVIEVLGPSILVGEHDGQPGALPDSLRQFIGLAEGYRSLRGGRGLAEFTAYLLDCQRFDAPPQLQSGPAGHGVTLMTVHAAKGLEFPVVVLPFLSASVFPDTQGRGRWPTRSAAVPPVAPDEPDPARTIGFPDTHSSRKDYDAYLDLARQDERRDEDRLAYVAVTRAQRTLIASGHWWGPTQTKPRGPSQYLLAIKQALRGGASGDVDQWCPEPGDRPDGSASGTAAGAWPGVAGSPSAQRLAREVTAHAEELTGLPPVPAWDDLLIDLLGVRTDGEGGVQVPELWSTSEFVRALADPEAFRRTVTRPMPKRPSPAAERGTSFHAWVEGRLGQQSLFQLSELSGELSDPVDAEQFEDLFGRTAYADRPPHVLEQPFVLAAGELAITGRIDAVFPVLGTPGVDWEVVDWKTGSPERADPLQLAVYRSAWARIAGCSPRRVIATFVFLGDGSHRTFGDLPELADLGPRLHVARTGQRTADQAAE